MRKKLEINMANETETEMLVTQVLCDLPSTLGLLRGHSEWT